VTSLQRTRVVAAAPARGSFVSINAVSVIAGSPVMRLGSSVRRCVKPEYIKIGRSVFYRDAAIDAYYAEQTRPSDANRYRTKLSIQL
jgi:hypothetical protein